MDAGVKPQLQAVQNGNDLHVSIEPEPPGTILDVHEQPIQTQGAGLMRKLDEKGAEKVEFRKSTIAAIAVVPALLLVVLNYGASAIGWVRTDESRAVQMESLQKDVNMMKEDLKTIKDSMQQQAVKDAGQRGFKLGITAAEEPKGGK